MKKTFFIALVGVMPLGTSAQRQLKSSTPKVEKTVVETPVKSEVQTPVAAPVSVLQKYYGSRQGGFALSVNANPFLNYVGNMFNGTSNNSLSDFEGVSNKLFSGHTITGKYIARDNFALGLGLGYNNNYNTSYRFKDIKEIDLRTNLERQATTAFMLKFGGEYLLRPGMRLQPILGLDVVYVHENSWNYSTVLETVDNIQDRKEYDYYGEPVNKLGLIANVGVEYFVCSNISLGATISLGLAKQWNKKTRSTDIVDGDDYSKYTNAKVQLMSGSSAAGANISMNFYF